MTLPKDILEKALALEEGLEIGRDELDDAIAFYEHESPGLGKTFLKKY